MRGKITLYYPWIGLYKRVKTGKIFSGRDKGKLHEVFIKKHLSHQLTTYN